MNYEFFGGRKQFNGYLYALLVTGMSFRLDPSFEAYSAALAVGLLGIAATIAWEDSKRL